ELPPPPPTDALPMKVQQVIPKDYALNQNYPNPFNPSTVIQFALPEASVVILSIYNIVGEQIANLMNGRMDAGIHRTTYSFDSENHRPVSSGIYFYRMSATSIESGKHFLEVKKMLVVK
ncbi:MAG TPA: T9SS type A sorting domain-containing protein, partial [Bacteroidota bacterium]|nr:T9SS type A sorting domain-containing protein [Bacteroidota bacterium]